MTEVVFDIESNGYLYDATKIWCIVLWDGWEYLSYYDLGTEPFENHNQMIHGKYSGNISAGVSALKASTCLVGHNIAGYDIPLIKKLQGVSLDTSVYDTLLASQLLYPERAKHSIEAWAKDLEGVPAKKQHEDWTRFSYDMLERCVSDVKINVKLMNHLRRTSNTWSNFELNMLIESKVSKIHANQEVHGVLFDKQSAEALVVELDDKISKLHDEIVKDAKPKLKLPYAKKKVEDLSIGEVMFDVDSPYKIDGSFKMSVCNWFKDQPSLLQRGKVGPHTRIVFEPLNLNSPLQVHEYLGTLGWKPSVWNFKYENGKKVKTSPKLTEESWDSLPGTLGKKIGLYKMMDHRRKYLQNRNDPTKGALATVRSDGRVPAEAITCGTPTSRYRHMRTVCNIPRPSTPYGQEIRSLFTVPSGHLMIGLDLSGIEARMMAHYAMACAVGSGHPRRIQEAQELMDRVLAPKGAKDFHSANAMAWGVDREMAKSGLYALMYGCYPPRLAETLEKPKEEGDYWMEVFWNNNPALEFLITNVEMAFKQNNYLKGIDERIIQVREKRKLLNTLLQGAAAVVFKMWMIKVDEYLTKRIGRTCRQIIAYHDEIQLEYYGSDVVEATILAKDIANLATSVGQQLSLYIPINADFKIGANWKETH